MPASPVFAGRRNDTLPQPIARGFFEVVEHPVAGEVNQWGMPVKPLTRPDWEWVQSPSQVGSASIPLWP